MYLGILSHLEMHNELQQALLENKHQSPSTSKMDTQRSKEHQLFIHPTGKEERSQEARQ